MRTFSFIPPGAGAATSRRIDLAQLAGRFAAVDAPSPVCRDEGRAGRIALLLLILLGAIGDTVLVSQHEALARCFAAGPQSHAAAPAGGL